MAKSLEDKYAEKLIDKGDNLTKEEAAFLMEYFRPKPKSILEQLLEVVRFINGGDK